ncbi:MAG: prolipoprotein diacylglyceryl transferase [Pseudomonadota bacterium]
MSYPYLSDVVKAVTGQALPLPIPLFGLCVAFAMLMAAAYLRHALGQLYRAGQIGPAHVRIKGEDGVSHAVQVAPSAVVSDLTLVVMIAGVVGSRLFHILEHTEQFSADPWGMIFTRSGLSIFGGLILGTAVGVLSLRRWRLPIRPFLDAVAPAMMLGYALGRIGCQIAGDGDWGGVADMARKPDWLPTWLWAQTYDNNIVGQLIQAPGVYPAPLYETLMGLACFVLLWSVRKHRHAKGWLFSLYLLLAGAERLLIEQVRVNPVFDIGLTRATQAEIIATALIAFGGVGLALLWRRAPPAPLPVGGRA